ncbi:MAG TPA: MATE family efflux transporter, partial [Rhizobiaceae bacterium]|nr:MATE family efflux transporter [Rhizobiaceae bacterium]
ALTALLGASGHTLDLATRFLQIVLPSTILMALGMCASGILRGVGDARRAMYVTLGGALASAILDPVLIFWFGLGIDGAAIATVISRLVLLLVGFHGAIVIHRLARWPRMPALRQSLRPFTAIAGPATMTQLATPVGNAFVTVEIAAFGDDAVAGWAIVGRLVPVAFGAVFALSGAVGPIIGQNYGARRYERVQSTMRDSLVFTLVNVLVMWALLALFHRQIADLFDADGLARTMVEFFCLYAAGSFLFNGALFVANAAFNNLGHALYSTLFNWGRATLGVIPFVWAGAALYGAEGILAGWGLGAVVFGIASVIVCFRIIGRLGSDPQAEAPGPDFPPAANSPFTSGKGAA